MQYSKPMIELVYEIRRRVPSELKPSVKLANPDLSKELADYYHCKTAKTVTKALIEALFSMAGAEWLPRLEKPADVHVRSVTKIYRGQVRLDSTQPVPPQEQHFTDSPAPGRKKPRMVYRGRVVD